MEQITLTTPDTGPATSRYWVDFIGFSFSRKVLRIELVGDNDLRRAFTYEGTDAELLTKLLNTADLSKGSLTRRLLGKLVADGKLEGTIAEMSADVKADDGGK